MSIELGELKSKGLQIVRGAFTGAARDDLEARGREVSQGVADGRFNRAGQFAAGMSRDWADAVVRSPALLDMIEAALGPDLCLFEWRVLMKDHHFNGPISVHQDWPYYGGGSAHKVNAFIPLTRVGRANGGLIFNEGSHHYGVLERGAIDAEAFPELPEVLPELEVGDVLLADFLTWHCSVPAEVAEERIMIQAIYQSSHDPSSKNLVRGEIRSPLRWVPDRMTAMKEPMTLINATTARQYLEAGDVARAEGFARGALSTDPGNAAAALLTYEILSARGDPLADHFLAIARTAVDQVNKDLARLAPAEAVAEPEPPAPQPPPWTAGRIARGVARRLKLA